MKKVKARVTEIDLLIGTFEENNNDLNTDIKIFERELERMEECRLSNTNPGEKISELLEKWNT
jgi:tRNA A-37 threonylcarbamoyl transferase component Bud32